MYETFGLFSFNKASDYSDWLHDSAWIMNFGCMILPGSCLVAWFCLDMFCCCMVAWLRLLLQVHLLYWPRPGCMVVMGIFMWWIFWMEISWNHRVGWVLLVCVFANNKKKIKLLCPNEDWKKKYFLANWWETYSYFSKSNRPPFPFFFLNHAYNLSFGCHYAFKFLLVKLPQNWNPCFLLDVRLSFMLFIIYEKLWFCL